jgi:signal transduction histidine kinase
MAKIRVRARAVDMLGRQQIAGIPTAIHELFKNAHDAYANHAEVDYFREDQTFVLRDDGYGMTKEEFEGRWLTLGTESKVTANRDAIPDFLEEGTPRRVVLGEKGIGRLAIATIGRQVLILSRARRKDGLQDLVVSFVHWGLFEAPGVDLDRIVIPVETLPGGTLPDEAFIKKLVAKVAKNVRDLSPEMEEEVASAILNELESFTIFPDQTDAALGGLSLRNDGIGTHFYIMPADPILERDIEEIGSDDIAAPLQKMLLGFSNTMMPARPTPDFLTAFRDHRRDGVVDDLIERDEFFTPEEFDDADHHFEGEIDEYGQFTGAISIYGMEPDTCTIEWPDGGGQKTACGSFKVKFAYVQGNRSESLLPPEEWARISAKLNKIGGLYIYRDGIRVLPYGNSDVDFLNIERRRTKSAQDWFFSYRRIFGAIELTFEHNADLKEKAGREGFITNKAYRQLREIMENIFMTLAKQFFRKEADRGAEFNRIKSDLEHQHKLLQKREKRVSARKRAFETALTEFFEKVEKGEPQSTSNKIRSKLESRLEAISNVKDKDAAVSELLKLETLVNKEISQLRDAYVVKKGRGFSISKKVQARWYSYGDTRAKLEKEVFAPLSAWADEAITAVAGQETIALDRRRRAKQALDDTREKNLRLTRAAGREALKEARDLVEAVRKDSSERISKATEAISQSLAEFAKIDTAALTADEIKEKQDMLERQILEAAESETYHMEGVISQLNSMAEAMNAGDSLTDETEALEASYVGVKEQLDLFSDLAQVGTALGIVQHEFGATIRSVRKNIQRLGEWAELDEELQEVYSDIRASFDHLDGYLNLFAPLNRRLQRHRIPISGEEIRRYLQDVFGDRLERHDIRMTGTRDFDRKVVEGYASTYYPCFVNLIDNAIYWIVNSGVTDRLITLDADDSGFLVMNTGPGVPMDLKDWIFGFTNSEKDGGRGMGLYISRQTLAKEGADIVLDNPGKENHPIFRIILPEKPQEEITDDELNED